MKNTKACFKNFAQRIGSIVNFDTFEKTPCETPSKTPINSLSLMIKDYFPNRLASLPFYHPILLKNERA